jgi:hypothetical protein
MVYPMEQYDKMVPLFVFARYKIKQYWMVYPMEQYDKMVPLLVFVRYEPDSIE